MCEMREGKNGGEVRGGWRVRTGVRKNNFVLLLVVIYDKLCESVKGAIDNKTMQYCGIIP